MSADIFYNFLQLIQRLGIWLSILAWISVCIGTIIMVYILRQERRISFWFPAIVITVIALIANLSDFVVTLHISPDLDLEANPIWRNVVDSYGLTVALWYGFTGKIFVSALAGLMYGFYLKNRHYLFPIKANSLLEFIRRMGNNCHTVKERFIGLFSVFCFFFAFIQLFYFYISYLNWQAPFRSGSDFLWLFIPLMMMLLLITIGFLIFTYQSFKKKFRRGLS